MKRSIYLSFIGRTLQRFIRKAPEILFAEKLLATGMAGEILDPDVMLDNMLLHGVLALEGGRAL